MTTTSTCATTLPYTPSAHLTATCLSLSLLSSPVRRPLSPLNPHRYPSPSTKLGSMQGQNQQHPYAWQGPGSAYPLTPAGSSRGGVRDEQAGADQEEDEMQAEPRSSSPPLTSPTPSFQYNGDSPFFRSDSTSPALTFSVGSSVLPVSSRERARQQVQAASSGHASPVGQQDVSLKDQMWKEKFRQRCLKGPKWTLGTGSGGGRQNGEGNDGGSRKQGKRHGSRSGMGEGGMGGDGIASGSVNPVPRKDTNPEKRSRSAPLKTARSSSTTTIPPRHPISTPGTTHPSPYYSSDSDEDDLASQAQAENEEIFRRMMLKQNRVERHKVDVSYEREVGSLWSDPVALEEEIRLAGMEGDGDDFKADSYGGAGKNGIAARGNSNHNGHPHSTKPGPGLEAQQAESWEEEELRRLERDEAEMEAAALQAYMEAGGDHPGQIQNVSNSYSNGYQMDDDMRDIDWDEVLADDGLSGDEGDGGGMPDFSRRAGGDDVEMM